MDWWLTNSVVQQFSAFVLCKKINLFVGYPNHFRHLLIQSNECEKMIFLPLKMSNSITFWHFLRSVGTFRPNFVHAKLRIWFFFVQNAKLRDFVRFSSKQISCVLTYGTYSPHSHIGHCTRGRAFDQLGFYSTIAYNGFCNLNDSLPSVTQWREISRSWTLTGASFAMETAGNVGNNGLRARCAVIRLETEEEVSTRQEQTDDKVLKSLSPLINSMKLFGLYFTRQQHPASEATNWRSLRRCKYWNPSRIYATVMLVVIWLNLFRYFIIFNGNETFGLDLFMKIAIISYALFNAILCIAYYVASHTGSLDRVLRQVTFSSADISSRYSRRTVVVTCISWTMVAVNILIYVYPIFFNPILPTSDVTLILYINTFRISKRYIFKIIFTVLQVHAIASWMFPQATGNVFFSLRCLFPVSSRIVVSWFLKQWKTMSCSLPLQHSLYPIPNYSRTSPDKSSLQSAKFLTRISSSNELHRDYFALRSVQ